MFKKQKERTITSSMTSKRVNEYFCTDGSSKVDIKQVDEEKNAKKFSSSREPALDYFFKTWKEIDLTDPSFAEPQVSKIIKQIDYLKKLLEPSTRTEKIWMPKILVLVSEYPYFDWMKVIITDFYNYFRSGGMNNVIEAHAFNVVFKITAPQRD